MRQRVCRALQGVDSTGPDCFAYLSPLFVTNALGIQHTDCGEKRDKDSVTQRQIFFFKCQKTCDTLNSDALCVGCNIVVYSIVFAEKQLRTRSVECNKKKKKKISLDELQSCCKPASLQTSFNFCHKKRHF